MSRLEENNLTKKLKHNGFRLYLFSFLIAPSGYLLKLMIARELSIEDIGLFYSILGLISIISSYNDLGLTEALQYFLPKYLLRKEIDKARSLIWFTRGMQFITGILISGALYLSAPWLAGHYFESDQAVLILRIFCLYFFIINLYQVLQSIFVANQQVKWYQGVEFIKMWSVVLFTFCSIYWWNIVSIYWYTAWWLVGIAIGTCGALVGTLKLYPWIIQGSLINLKKYMLIKDRLSYGFRVMLGQSAGTLFLQVNQQLVIIFLGAKAAGIWAYFITFVMIVTMATNPITSYLFPLLNELHEKGNTNKIHQLYTYLLVTVIGVGFIGGILSWYLAPRASVFLFGESFRESGILFRHFSPWIWMLPLIGFVFADIASRGLVKERVWILLLGLSFNLLATYGIIHTYGLLGSVYGYVIGMFGLLLGIGSVYYSILIQKQILGKKH